MSDILVLGELNADLILQGDVEPAWNQAEKLIDDATLTLGASSAIFACAAARLGLRVAFAGVVGDDLLGHFCRDELGKRGVDTAGVVIDPARRTGMTIILQRPTDRAMLTFSGAIAALRSELVAPEALNAARHIHVGAYYLQDALRPGLPRLFAEARRRGATTSLDTNWDPAERWLGLDTLLPETDVLLPNEAEACRIAGSDDWQEALALLATRVPTVALKRGADGAVAVRGGERVIAMAPQVEVVDAVGAGDTFDAGFIVGLLAGWPLERTLRLAVACGTLSTRAAGGTAGQPDLAEAEAFAEQVRMGPEG